MTDLRDQPPTELVGRLVHQVAGLLKNEWALAQHELRGKGAKLIAAAVLLGGAVTCALLGAIASVITAIVLLHALLPLWAAALIVMAVAFIFAAILAIAAQGRIAAAMPLVPERALRAMREDLQWTKVRLSSNGE